MYSDFFGLKHSPFNNTPDPRFFFNTPDHEEAVASLVYAAQERKGFALLTGEVGSGKTLVSRLVLSRLERSAKFAVVHNTRVGPRELLFSICREFDVRVAPDASAPEMSRGLEEFLLDQYARDRLAVVIVDEAQHLTTESFEELRLLGNLEADDAKLLSVLILGQPELQALFQLPEMQQLQQRLFRSYHLKALSRELTEGYVAHRLRVAGIQKSQGVFDRAALDAVYAASGGIPRLINQICDGAMLAAYTRSTKRITGAIVEEAVEQCLANPERRDPPRANFMSTNQPASTNESSSWSNSPQRVIVETGPAEEAVRFLERRVREAVRDCEDAKKTFERALASFKDEFTRAKGETGVDLSTARSELERRIAEATRLGLDIESRTDGLSAQMTAALAEMRRVVSEMATNEHTRRSLAEEIEKRVEAAKRDLESHIESQRAGIEASLVAAADQASRKTEGLEVIAQQIRSGAVAELQAARTDLEYRITEAVRLSADIESQTNGLSAQMTAALHGMRQGLQETLRESKQVGDVSRSQTEASLAQLRALLEQITQRADTARRDLVDLSDQVKHGSARSVEGLKEIVAELLQQIDDKSTQIHRDTEQSCDRIGRLEHRFSEGAGSAKASLQQIIDDARSRFDAAHLQAGDILNQAQSAAAATQEQAAIVLAEARGAAQRLREQMEQDARRTDAAAANTRQELQELRADLRRDREQVREQIVETKSLLGEARQEAVRILDQARTESARLIEMANATTSRLYEEAGRFERESQVRAERIIHQSQETGGRIDALLRLPKEIIDEAGVKTATLAELSKSLSSVIVQLSAAGGAARSQNQEIAEASNLAEERLEALRNHSTRVGQLVGVIRQLYGIMDARIEGLRGRLDQAEHLCRTVPEEIEGLRSALGGDRNGRRSAEVARAIVPRLKNAPPTTKGRTNIVKSTPGAPAMLGDIVSRNRKLHEWLRQTLRAAETNGEIGSERRIDRPAREVEKEKVTA